MGLASTEVSGSEASIDPVAAAELVPDAAPEPPAADPADAPLELPDVVGVPLAAPAVDPPDDAIPVPVEAPVIDVPDEPDAPLAVPLPGEGLLDPQPCSPAPPSTPATTRPMEEMIAVAKRAILSSDPTRL
jgi:hypothetical protein